MLTAAALAALAVVLWPARDADGWRVLTSGAPRPPAVRGWGRWRGVRVGRSRRGARHPWVADLAEVAAVGLDAGLDLASAALVAARSPSIVAAAPWLGDHLAASVEAGRGVADIG
ncbi:MAG TPA: hypothetical protein VN257_11265, partial [Actinotalea sp.]|nr:hypothetical protein [Actinotalea sp.]